MLRTALGRVFLAVVSLAVAFLLFRGQIADALIVRGDDLLIRNAYGAAEQRYARALWLSPDSAAAVDRLSFVALQLRTTKSLRAETALASNYLRSHPFDETILADRALCYLKLGDYRSAYRDFARVAILSHDPQQYAFAGWAARRSGNVKQAVAEWTRALEIHRGYKPAADALSLLGR